MNIIGTHYNQFQQSKIDAAESDQYISLAMAVSLTEIIPVLHLLVPELSVGQILAETVLG